MHHLFLDELGDHSLARIDAGYPVFVLGGILVAGDCALRRIEHAVATLKRDFFGDTALVLHTADITRNRRGFERLADPEMRNHFHCRLNTLLNELDFTVVACVIRKRALLERHGALAVDPYMLSLGILVERFCFELGGSGRQGIIVVRRNERLDHELTVAWDMLRLNGTRYVRPEVLRRRIAALEFATKVMVAPGSSWPTSWSRPWAAGSPASPEARPRRRRASCAVGRRAAGKVPGWSFCPKKVAGDRYAIPDHGQCRRAPFVRQSPVDYETRTACNPKSKAGTRYAVSDLARSVGMRRLGVKSDQRIGEALASYASRADPQGRWALQQTFNDRFVVPIETKGEPSRWVTLRALEGAASGLTPSAQRSSFCWARRAVNSGTSGFKSSVMVPQSTSWSMPKYSCTTTLRMPRIFDHGICGLVSATSAGTRPAASPITARFLITASRRKRSPKNSSLVSPAV